MFTMTYHIPPRYISFILIHHPDMSRKSNLANIYIIRENMIYLGGTEYIRGIVIQQIL